KAAPVSAPAPVAAPAPAAAPVAEAPPPNGHAAGDERIFASPLARRMAKQAGIDLSGLKGSGPNGRIVKADIDAAQAGGKPVAAPAAAPAPAPAARAPAAPITAPHQLVPHNNIRKIVARRLSESKQSIPHFYVSIDVELDALRKLRGELNAKSPA